jgi:hypothetical protein
VSGDDRGPGRGHADGKPRSCWLRLRAPAPLSRAPTARSQAIPAAGRVPPREAGRGAPGPLPSVDGRAIDPWHLATILEGLSLRMDPYLSMLDRDAIFDAARHAFDQYQWVVTPDFDQEGEIQAVETALAGASGATTPITGGRGLHAWLGRHWRRQGIFRWPIRATIPNAMVPRDLAAYRARLDPTPRLSADHP